VFGVGLIARLAAYLQAGAAVNTVLRWDPPVIIIPRMRQHDYEGTH
jgi:cytochrome P450